MVANHYPISTKEQELNSLLKEWGKKRTKRNRILLNKKIAEFRSLPVYSPHNRESFYTYVRKCGIKTLFDNTLKPAKKKQLLLQSKIQKKAYDIYVLRVKDAIPGNPFTDWLLAEKAVKKEIKKKQNVWKKSDKAL
ncbi:MAG: hypothetical protein JXB88_11495 [Spirochaetales bacterium]|nr:hypothetical protein [Spirochaetales bacterium]